MKIMVSCRSEVKGQEFSAWFSLVEQDWSVWSEQPHWAAYKGSGLSPLAAGRDPTPVAGSALHAGMLIVVGKNSPQRRRRVHSYEKLLSGAWSLKNVSLLDFPNVNKQIKLILNDINERREQTRRSKTPQDSNHETETCITFPVWLTEEDIKTSGTL